jgi:hypothetical protein
VPDVDVFFEQARNDTDLADKQYKEMTMTVDRIAKMEKGVF